MQDNTSQPIRRELNIHWHYKNQTTRNNHSDICPKKGKEKSNIEMDARRKLVKKNYAKAPYNRTSECHVTEHVPHMLTGAMASYNATQSRYVASQ